jgi:hypothetical protein
VADWGEPAHAYSMPSGNSRDGTGRCGHSRGAIVGSVQPAAAVSGESASCGNGTLASLLTGLHGPTYIAVSGSDLFVTNANGNSVGEYTTSGATVYQSCTVTSLFGGGKSGPKISVGSATAVTDHASLSGTNAATATGKVTYTVYSNKTCTLVVHRGTPLTFTKRGTLPASKPVSLSTAGTYYWQASYSGNTNYLPSESKCGSEVETVT